MPWDGSGNFVLTQDFPQDRDLGRPDSLIDADKFDAEFENFKVGLQNCFTIDGQNEAQADLPMGGFSFTGMRAAEAADEPVIASQAATGAFDWVGLAGGTANALTGDLTYAPTLVAGVRIKGIASATNTGATTFALNGGSLVAVKRRDGTALQAGDITSGYPFELLHNGTNWLLDNPLTVDGRSTGAFVLSGVGVSTSAITATAPATWQSLAAGQLYVFIPTTNVGANPTLAINGGAANPVKDKSGNALPANALQALTPYITYYTAGSEHRVISNLDAVTVTGTTLDSLSDVAAPTPASGDYLKHNGVAWVNAPLAEALALTNLSDVAITTPASRHGIIYNGSSWVNTSLVDYLTLDDLSGVSVSGSASGEVLGFDGTNWRNRTVAASLGYTPANRAGDTFTGGVSLPALTMLKVGAAEGGEIILEKGASGNTLSGDVKVDISGNQIRFWDSGGTLKGAYLDLTQLGAGASSKIWTSDTDGSGSGLDADLLDGQDSSYYTAITTRLGYTPANKAGDTMTGALGITAGLVSATGLFFSGDTNTGLWTDAADTLKLATGGTNRITVSSTGVVSIGTTAAVGTLTIGGRFTCVNTFGSFELLETTTTNGFRFSLANAGVLYLQQTANAFAAATTPFFIDSAGKIGINQQTSPAEALDVLGNIKASGTIRTGSYTVAALPAAATAGTGALATCSDTTGTAWMTAPTGGSSTFRTVVSTGTSWLAC